jgi:ABC-type transport system involved in multi-copper enzyme maturation permease subunit
MRPYFAIIKDSFREALASRVLWIVLALVTLTLLAFAPLTYREEATVGLRQDDVEGWPLLIDKLREASNDPKPSAARRIWSLLDDEGKKLVREFKGMPDKPTFRDVGELRRAGRVLFQSLNKVIRRDDLDDGSSFAGIAAGNELKQLQKTPYNKLTRDERLRVNRLLMEAAFPELVTSSPATSMRFRYAVWDLSMPVPIRKKQFTEALFKQLPWLIDKGILSIGLLIAVMVTAPIVPQMFDPNSLHLLLSKPITRPLLYLSKFLGGCAFVCLAATYLFVGLWVIFGVQWGIWEPQLLWCIPVYVFVFATYYSVSALAGAVWRNTIVSIIFAILFWVLCFSVGTGESTIGGMILRYRLARLVPAGGDLFAADEVNTLLVWNDTSKSWKALFTSPEHEQIRTTLILLSVPHPPPLVGPAYDERNGQVVAAAPSFKMFGRMVMVGVHKGEEWKAAEGPPPTGQPIALGLEAGGAPLLVTNTGLWRVVRNVTGTSVMLQLPGLSIPLTRAEALVSAGPSPAEYWGDPASAAIDSKIRRVFIYSRGELTLLEAGDGDNYEVVAEKKLPADQREPAVLTAGGEKCFVALKKGRILAYAARELAAAGDYQLPGESPPRTLAITPDGKRLFALAHDGTLYVLDLATGKFTQPKFRGQGDISALTITPDGKLYIASRATRVSEYDLATMQERRVLAPPLNLQEKAYYYGIEPAHNLLPKPGEFYKTVQYLLLGEKTSGESDENLATAQEKLDPWSPIWSGLAFQAIMLALGCLYIQRQEF